MGKGGTSPYDPEKAEIVLQRMKRGETIAGICRDLKLREGAVYDWKASVPEFAERYAPAREAQAHAVAERAYNIAHGDEDVPDRRTAFDAGRWLAGKLAPRHYGEKITQEHVGADGGPVVFKWQD